MCRDRTTCACAVAYFPNPFSIKLSSSTAAGLEKTTLTVPTGHHGLVSVLAVKTVQAEGQSQAEGQVEEEKAVSPLLWPFVELWRTCVCQRISTRDWVAIFTVLTHHHTTTRRCSELNKVVKLFQSGQLINLTLDDYPKAGAVATTVVAFSLICSYIVVLPNSGSAYVASTELSAYYASYTVLFL